MPYATRADIQLAVWILAEQHYWFEKRLEFMMGAVQDAVDAVAVQLVKAKNEILSLVADLEAQLAAGEVPNLDALKAAAQSLDDIVVDVPVEEPPVV